MEGKSQPKSVPHTGAKITNSAATEQAGEDLKASKGQRLVCDQIHREDKSVFLLEQHPSRVPLLFMQHGVKKRALGPPLHSATEKKRERKSGREGEHSMSEREMQEGGREGARDRQ